MAATTNLQTRFKKEIVPELMKALNLKNQHMVPRITKIKLNAGIGTYLKAHAKDHETVINSMKAITGQKPVVTKAKKAISNFKVRAGEISGVTVTMRGERMYHFINKLVNVVFPRVRDFRGISPKSFDGQGNYSIGFKEHVAFPEVNSDDVTKIHGLQINICTSADSDEQALELLKLLGFPFKK